ncbi:MAG: phytanoyl-CoA dioxygenase family protein [Planctomycetota bacterium]|nr:phytanoyl-CoA dioxygenase family protein [Planctomycetota bacterium]MDA1213171.1 phytanoyl-CoA dioxygenase family protein [Planctomycetota bacterium]
MSFEDLKPDFDRNGFAVVRNFLSKADFDEVTGELDRYIRDIVPTLPDSAAFYHVKGKPETLKQMQHMQHDPYFRDYVKHPRWKELAEALVGEEANCQSTEWFNKPANTEHPTPPHQDNYYFNLTPPNVLTIWMALEPVDEENGCLRYVAGSHLMGRRPHARSNVLGFSQGITDYGPEDTAREVVMCLNPGDAIVHHGWTIHRAEPNRSTTRSRKSFAMVFKGVSCRLDTDNYKKYEDDVKTQHQQMGLQTT